VLLFRRGVVHIIRTLRIDLGACRRFSYDAEASTPVSRFENDEASMQICLYACTHAYLYDRPSDDEEVGESGLPRAAPRDLGRDPEEQRRRKRRGGRTRFRRKAQP
jgi:hypothetical protein